MNPPLLSSAARLEPTPAGGTTCAACSGSAAQDNHRGRIEPAFYSSIGEAVGAAMQHNIRLAHRSVAPSSDKPL